MNAKAAKLIRKSLGFHPSQPVQYFAKSNGKDVNYSAVHHPKSLKAQYRRMKAQWRGFTTKQRIEAKEVLLGSRVAA